MGIAIRTENVCFGYEKEATDVILQIKQKNRTTDLLPLPDGLADLLWLNIM